MIDPFVPCYCCHFCLMHFNYSISPRAAAGLCVGRLFLIENQVLLLIEFQVLHLIDLIYKVLHLIELNLLHMIDFIL